MQPVIYDVAVSLVGFISGPDGDISRFAQAGPVVDDYAARLGGYGTAIMGRKTYEFGYAYGLTPGQTPYPHMDTLVFSRGLRLPEGSPVSVVSGQWAEALRALKSRANRPIYLCGGGAFAGWALDHGLIDRLILKRAPVCYGAGVPLFGGATQPRDVTRLSVRTYDNGYLLETFALA
ncbi:dihydrofolate reductase family protein [Dinoroseobacter sp. S375]|uniref:dihydrofolate reductase family protein n=1 Tax=Dinoroseobacter sp. S375 TaxID=3415136 RepID=UPI003C79E9D1